MFPPFLGNGSAGFVNGHISIAQFSNPLGLVVDQFDNIYVSEQGNIVIRKIDTLGNVTTYAGSGASGYLDGAGAVAQFVRPGYMCLDDSTNLYIADGGANSVIRKIDTHRNVSTFAGSGVLGFQDGPVSTATFDYPISIAHDKLHHAFFVVDRDNNAVRKIFDGLVTTIAGTGSPGHLDGPGALAQFNGPKGVVCDSLGNVYIAGRLDYTIRKIDTLGNVSTIAGVPNNQGYLDGPVATAQFGRPIEVLFDRNHNLLVSDYDNFVIRGVEVAPLTSIHQPGPQSISCSLYPNPAQADLHLQLETPLDAFEVEILGLQGQKVFGQSYVATQNVTLNTAPYAAGLYFIKISSDLGSRVMTFAKQ